MRSGLGLCACDRGSCRPFHLRGRRGSSPTDFYKTKDCQLVCANGGQLDRVVVCTGESGSFLCVYVIHFKKSINFTVSGIWLPVHFLLFLRLVAHF